MGKKEEPPPEPIDEVEEENKARESFKTVPSDARYPNQNCTFWCYEMFRDYHRCIQLFEEGYEPCNQFKKIYEVICPNAWVDRWNDKLDNGTFPGTLPNDCHKHKYYKYQYQL